MKKSDKLYRNTNNCIVGGVCSGLGNYFDIDPTLIRVIWAISIMGYGMGLFLYLIMWCVMPEK